MKRPGFDLSSPIPEQAPARRTTHLAHGKALIDDYGWLRADNWQEVLKDPAVLPAEIRDVLARLPEAERQLLPKEVLPTVDALAERIFSLGASLHQLETDASVFAIEKLEHRIADARATPDGSSARARLLELLERQLVTVRALAATRDTVRGQLESASTVLETMRLDLLTLRSSGLDTRMASSAEATQQARALSRDIARAIEAADEVRRI